MKKLLFLMLLLGFRELNTQSQYRKGTDEAFASLDMTGVTSGILYDRVGQTTHSKHCNAPTPTAHSPPTRSF